ncbi:hypothetical protein AB0L44_45420 [Nonomuraea wenchangensis]|uniref:hypothetical protein n=1 Tax=Nonomuraea wenchangensis TaxID=568860 RepID=UPI003414CE6F
MLAEKLAALSHMMTEHMAMPFPPGFRGLDIEDQDMVMLDADAYGLAMAVLEGPLSARRRSHLTRLTSAFEKVLLVLDDQYAIKYYTHGRDMVVLATEIESRLGERDREADPLLDDH